jgi:hypothetical protein
MSSAAARDVHAGRLHVEVDDEGITVARAVT